MPRQRRTPETEVEVQTTSTDVIETPEVTETPVIPVVSAPQPDDLSLLTPGERLRRSRTGCKLSISRWGTKKTLSKTQKDSAASSFGAQGKRLSASKAIVNGDNEYVAAVTKILSRLAKEWKERTDPWLDEGVRLLQTSQVNLFNDYILTVRPELQTAVAELQSHLADVKDEARSELGDLFNEEDYPVSVVDKYSFAIDYPSLEPPAWLQGVNPDVYKEQCERVSRRFDEAAALGEAVFVETFADLVSHLSEKLQPGEEGTRKIFRGESVENIHNFIQRFKSLYVGTNAELEGLVTQAQEILSVNTPGGRVPVNANEIRTIDWIGSQVRTGMERLKTSLEGVVQALPRRQFSQDVSAKLNEVEL